MRSYDYSYDGLGRLSTVTYGNGVSESRTYTVQGWLKEIEAGTASGDAVFHETLRYWENGSTSSLYSGMVSGTSTQNGGPFPLDYDYVYDYLWRILRAGPPASDSWGEKGISYDRNGNLRSLTRYGGDGSVTDMLNMSYIGNVLSGVTHNGVTKLYSHDVGGRLTEDGRTGVSVSYDVTGMPETTRASAQTARGTETVHSYLSDGTRLGVSMTLGTGHLQVRSGYENYGSLTFREIGGQQSFESSLFGGGVILSDGVRYFTRDHLGNTRVVTDGSGNVVERDDYYPFGERHEDSSMTTMATNRWRFAGKEIQPLGSTGWIDFGARQYDSFLGRWTTVDPLAEKYPGLSPYLYCAGNPVNFVDRSGQFPETLWDIANVVMDVKSLASNLRQGKIGAAIVDGVGLTLDAAAAALPLVPGGVGTGIKATRLADNALDAVGNVKDTGKSLSRIKEALIEAKSRIGLSPNESLPKFEGKHGSPSRGDQIKGYRLDPPHDKNGSESVPHINYWDYTNGKRKNGGVSGSVEIKE